MAKINMNELPVNKPAMNNIIPKGRYVGQIIKAEMKQPKDPERPMYFSAECDITDPQSNTNMGKFWIRLFESEAPLVRYQLSRFITALKLPITGEFELKDLTKVVVNKKLFIDIAPEERKDNNPPTQSVVDINGECFYPVDELQRANEAVEAAIADTFATPNEAPVVQSSY